MPTVLRIGSTRFFFFSNEGHESPLPVSSASSSRFHEHELRRLERDVTEHRRAFLEAWREHFWT